MGTSIRRPGEDSKHRFTKPNFPNQDTSESTKESPTKMVTWCDFHLVRLQVVISALEGLPLFATGESQTHLLG